MRALYAVLISISIIGCAKRIVADYYPLTELPQSEIIDREMWLASKVQEHEPHLYSAKKVIRDSVTFKKFANIVVRTSDVLKISTVDPFDARALIEAKKNGAEFVVRANKTYGPNVTKGDNSLVAISYDCFVAVYNDRVVPPGIVERANEGDLSFEEFWVWIRAIHTDMSLETSSLKEMVLVKEEWVKRVLSEREDEKR